MDKIAIFNQKGGVGKTALTANIASALSERFNKKVLIVDSDAQCNLTNYMSASIPDPDDESVPEKDRPEIRKSLEMFEKAPSLFDLIKKGKLFPIPITFYNGRRKVKTNVSLIRGDVDLDMLNSKDIEILRDRLLPLEDEYDYCLFDLSPQKTTANIFSLCATDYVLIPVNADPDSIAGINMVLDLCDNFHQSQKNTSIETIGILLNDIDRRESIQKYMEENCRVNCDDLIFKSSVRHSSKATEARLFGVPVNHKYSKTPLCFDYYEVTLELIQTIENKKRKAGK